MRTLTLLTLLAAAPGAVAGQTRAQQLAAVFTKHKEMVADKRGVRKEKYKDVRSEPWVQQDIATYSGVYQVNDLGDVMDLRVDGEGRIQAEGHDSDRPGRPFVLQDAKIAGAVLTGTKVYRDGASEPFEGVFMTRIERSSRTDPGITTTGLGVVLHRPREFGGNTYDKLFYQLQH